MALGYVSVALQFSGSNWPITGQWSLPIVALLTFTVVAQRYARFAVSVVDWVAATLSFVDQLLPGPVGLKPVAVGTF